jgi:hypothetical protein
MGDYLMSLILNGTNGVSDVDGSASTPAVRGTDTNTGIFFPATDTIAFAEGGAEVARFDSSGNLGLGTTSPARKVEVKSSTSNVNYVRLQENTNNTPTNGGSMLELCGTRSNGAVGFYGAILGGRQNAAANNAGYLAFYADNNDGQSLAERMRIDSSGNLLFGKTTSSFSVAGSILYPSGQIYATVNSDDVMAINRLGNDGNLIRFFQATTEEGNISVSGTTVSYNGGHLARWSQLLDGSKDESILKGTVLSNLDEMCVWEKDGVVADNEQLNKMKVSDVEGDTNVAGVFVNWTIDEQYGVDDMNIAMTGDMIIRIAQGVTVQRGDLLMSAGDGTAKPQSDDIVRSKTIAKVTSTHITCTYADGSYCVPCVLMAC